MYKNNYKNKKQNVTNNKEENPEELLNLISKTKALVKQNNPIEAIRLIKEGRYKNKKALLVILASAYEKKGDYLLGIETLNQIAGQTSKEYLSLGHLYKKMGNHEEANKYFKLCEQGGSTQKYPTPSSISQKIESKDKASKISKPIHDKNSAFAQLNIAKNYLDKKYFDEAMFYLKKILDTPQQSEIIKNKTIIYYAQCLKGKGKYQEAIKYLIENNHQESLALACCYDDNGEFVNAKKIYDKLLLKNPNDNTIRLTLAYHYKKSGDPNNALETIYGIKEWRTNPEHLLFVGRIKEEMALFPEAIEKYKQMLNFSNHIGASIAMAYCYVEMGEIDNAWEALKNLKAENEITRENIVLCEAMIYKSSNQFKNAINTLEEIPHGKENPRVCMQLGGIYFAAGDFEAALKYYYKCKNLSGILSISHCYQAMGQYDKAIEIYNQEININPNDKILVDMAICYNEMNQYKQALDSLDKISQTNSHAILIRARTLQTMGYPEKALKCITKAPNYLKNIPALIVTARILAEMNQHQEAVEIYKGILAFSKNHKETIFSYARCLQEMGKYKKGKQLFANILHHEKEKQLEMAQFYVRTYNYNQAIKIYNEILQKSKEDKPALLGLGHCYRKAGKMENALLTFKKIPNWQEDKNALLGLAYTDNEAYDIISSGRKHYPYCEHFFILEMSYFQKRGNKEKTKEVLLAATQTLPYSTLIALKVVEYFLSIKDSSTAKFFEEKYTKHFSSYAKFLNKMQLLFKCQNFPTLVSLDELTPNKLQIVKLTELQSKIFSLLPANSLLGGGAVIRLLKPEFPAADLDYMMPEGAKAPKEFAKCAFIPGLYTYNNIDLIDHKPDVIKGAFTISTLFCNEKGEILDPTGKGLTDLHNNCLRTNIDPEVSFKEDPTRLLRAIYYINQGVNPTPEVAKALTNWMPLDCLKKDHMHRVLEKYALSSEKENIVKFKSALCLYGLTEKLLLYFKDHKYETQVYNLLAQDNASNESMFSNDRVGVEEEKVDNKSIFSNDNVEGLDRKFSSFTLENNKTLTYSYSASTPKESKNLNLNKSSWASAKKWKTTKKKKK